jgi:hypothetical protein
MRLSKILTLALVLGAVFNAPQISAVFYLVQKYEHPQTGNQVVLFHDVHIDIDPLCNMTLIQRHDLLSEAKKEDALIIAEDKVESESVKAVYLAFIVGGIIGGSLINGIRIGMAIPYAKLVNKMVNFNIRENIVLFCIPPCVGALFLHWLLWGMFFRKPSLSFNEYIAKLNKKYESTSLLTTFGISPMQFLVQQAKRHEVQALSIEFRNRGNQELKQERGLSWLIDQLWLASNWTMRKLTSNKNRCPVTVKDYYQNQNKVLKEIASYNDGPVPKDFYNQCIAGYRAGRSYIIEELRTLAKNDPNQSLSTLVSTLAKKLNKDCATVYRDLQLHDSNLLDARAIHLIHANRHRKTIFVCVGGWHAENIGRVLEKMGYRVIGHYANHTAASVNLIIELVGEKSKIQLKDFEILALDLQKVFAA